MAHSNPYNEDLLQWLWKNRYLCDQNLATPTGKKVTIHHPGYWNKSDGPDFTNARISIGSLKWHGDVEIHWQARDWFSHSHHTDKNFNKVILHVVFDDAATTEVHRLDGTVIPTLYMKTFLPENLQYFFDHYQQPNTLPCAGNLSHIPLSILNEQFDDAQSEYFEQKVNDLLDYYDTSLPLSRAWKYMLIIALFDGLGISHNRAPMRKLAQQLWNNHTNAASVKDLTSTALQISGIDPEDDAVPYQWKRKGSRPANHPNSRIRQACTMLWFINHQPFNWWIRTNIEESFRKLLQQIDTTPGLGDHRAGVLYGTVWSAAWYLLGDFTGNKTRMKAAKDSWMNHRTPLPVSLTKPFKQSGMPAAVFEQRLGTVHQYRAYCKPHKCQQCKVFNFIISS